MAFFANLSAMLFGDRTDRVRLVTKQPPDPEPVFAQPRNVTGLLRSLTPKQLAYLEAHEEPEDFGDPSFPKLKTPAAGR